MCPMKGVEGSRASYLQVQVDHAALVQQVNSLKHLSDQTGDLTFGQQLLWHTVVKYLTTRRTGTQTHSQLFLVLSSTILPWTGHTIDISNHSTHYSSIRTRSWSVSYTEFRFTTRGLFFAASKTAISWITSALQSRPRRRFLMNFAAKTFPVAFSAHLFTTANFPLRETNRNRKNIEKE